MIYAVIITYNPNKELLDLQFNSLEKQVDKIVYIDNASNENINPNNEKTILVQNYHNLGLGKAQNQGIKIALNNGADFILLFDQDSVPPCDFVLKLMQVYMEAKKIFSVGLVAPAIKNDYNKDFDIENYGILIRGIELKRVPLDRITNVSYCIASGSLIPSDVFSNVGYIKEEMFIDGMDFEWCLRAKSKGFSIIQTNITFLSHRLGDGDKDRILSHSPLREYYIVRNSIWMSQLSYIPLGYKLRKIIMPFLRLVQSFRKGQWGYVKQQIKGIKDGFKYKKGRGTNVYL